MRLFRVHLWDPRARAGEPFSAGFIPPQQGYGRWDNPELYTLRYAARSPEGAIIESFGAHAVWRDDMFRTGAGDAVRALSTFEVPDDTVLADLADPALLLELGARVTDVSRREPRVTQRLAARLYASHRFDGIAWWSFFHPHESLVALFQPDEARVVTTAPLSLDTPEVVRAAELVVRSIER